MSDSDRMTPRECFREAMHVRGTGHLPWHEAVPDSTVLHWIRQGLPLESALSQPATELSSRGGMISKTKPRTFDVSGHFGFRNALSTPLEIELGPLPRFVPRVLQRGDNWMICVTEHGVTQKLLLDTDYFMPQFLDFPVKTMADWREYEKRLDPTDPRRYPKVWGDEFVEFCRSTPNPVGIGFHGFYALGRELMGTVEYLTAFLDDPALVHRMLNYWADFLVETLRRAVETFKSDIDFIFWHEDMAYKNGPFFSPQMFREFMLPCYRKLTDLFHRNGIDVILLDSDGDARLLIPLLLDAGVNGIWSLEVAAGMDAVALRKQYGRDLILAGGIDKRIIASGDEGAIQQELKSKVPYLMSEGGYIASLDHLVPPNTPLQAFSYYAGLMREYQ